jgi:hypothetical protein
VTGREVRGLLVVWVRLLTGKPVTYKQAWLGAIAALLPVFAFAYGLSAAGTALLGLPHLSLLSVVACSAFGCLVTAVGASRKIHRQRRIETGASATRVDTHV